MSNPKISVIITTFNRADYLNFAVESVLKQTFQDYELIIMDDGSTDNTKSLVKSYNDKRIKYYYQSNLGQNPTRNKGIELSKGKYVALLDSDDIWVDTFLEKQVNILDRYPDIGLVYCGTALIDFNNNEIGKKPLASYKGNVLKKLLMTNFLYNGSCALFRKNCLKKVGLFDCSIKRMTDWEFYLRFAMHYKFFGVKEYLLKYRLHSLCMSNNLESYKTCGPQILDKIFNHNELDSKYLKYKNKAFAMRYRYLARRHFQNGDMQECRNSIKEAINYDKGILYSTNIPILYIFSYLPARFIDLSRTFKNWKII